MPFESNVFVNCPFDRRYLRLLHPLLFAILDLGLEPRIALERTDSGEARFDKIKELILDSKFAIHDLSRLKSAGADEFYRLNMPFELGLDMGCRSFRSGVWSTKRCLILETELHRYRAALSDIAGFDVAAHGDKPAEIVTLVRNWLSAQAGLDAPGPSHIWGRFNDFMADNYRSLVERGFSAKDIARLPVDEFLLRMKIWLRTGAIGADPSL